MNANCCALLKEKDDTLFLHGACHVFALSLQDHFGYSLIYLATKDPKATPHVYCRFDGLHSVDVVGIESEEKALAQLEFSQFDCRPIEVARKELEARFTISDGGGLHADPEFFKAGEKRAQVLITKFKDYYGGRIFGDIPGMSRMRCASLREIHEIFER
jgi:hypothetical protein